MSLLLVSLLVFWIAGIPILIVAAAATLPRLLRRRESAAPVAPIVELFPARPQPSSGFATAELRARR
jgi:hypothetical protein